MNTSSQREPRIEDFPLKQIPHPVKKSVHHSAVPPEYYSPSGKFWRKSSAFLWTIIGFIIFFMPLVIGSWFKIPSLQSGFFGVLPLLAIVIIPLWAYVSRQNAKTKYENADYNLQVENYNQKKLFAEKEREQLFRQAHDTWMLNQGRLQVSSASVANDESISRFEHSANTQEIAQFIIKSWETYYSSFPTDPNVQETGTLCQCEVRKDQLVLSFNMENSNQSLHRCLFIFAEKRMASLQTDEQCAALASALLNVLQTHILFSIVSQAGSAFIIRQALVNPSYTPPVKEW